MTYLSEMHKIYLAVLLSVSLVTADTWFSYCTCREQFHLSQQILGLHIALVENSFTCYSRYLVYILHLWRTVLLVTADTWFSYCTCREQFHLSQQILDLHTALVENSLSVCVIDM